MKKINKKTHDIGIIFCIALFSMIIVFMPIKFVCAYENKEYESKQYWCGDINDEFAEDSVIVVLDKNISGYNKKHTKDFWGGISQEHIEELTKMSEDVEDLKYLNKESFRQIFKITIKNKNKREVIKTIRQLEKLKGIKWVGPNTYFSLNAVSSEEDNDLYSQAWGLHEENGINVEQAWNITTGSSSVKVGVIDSGVANHEDLNANVATGWDFVNNDNVTNDDVVGHGTHVAGIIGALGNNDKGVVGVSYNVQIIPMQIDNNQNVDFSAVVSSISWAIENNIDILNISSGTLRDTINWAALNNYNGLLVCAAGNSNSNNDDISVFPSNLSSGYDCSDRVISVGAIGTDGTKASYSNYGAESVSLFAPGNYIISTYPADYCTGNVIENVIMDKESGEIEDRKECEVYYDNNQPYFNGRIHCDNGYHKLHGTSMAAPFVAGVAALMLSVNPNLTAQELKAGIMNNVDEVDALEGLCVSGGRLNAFKAVSSVAYDFDATTGTITGLNFVPSEELTIPSAINGVNVVALKNNLFENNVTLTKMKFEIGSCLEYIGSNVFANCYNLTEITIPEEVTTIGDNAFAGCTSLTTVYYGGESETDWSSISIGTNNTYLTNAQKYYYEEDLSKATGLSHWRYVGNTPTAWPVVNFMSLTSNGGLLQGTTTQLTLRFDTDPGESFSTSNIWITGASIGALRGTGSTRTLEITAITVGNGGIVSLTLINTDEVIFANRIQEVSVYVSSGVSSGGINYTMLSDGSGYEVSSTNLSSTTRIVTIPSTVGGVPVVGIGESAFAGCTNLTLVNIPSSIRVIGNSAFENCSSLMGMVMPTSLIGIGNKVFKNCTSLASVLIGSSLVSIGDSAFENCIGLSNFVLPTGINNMGANAFKGCNNLTIYTAYTGVPSSGGLIPISWSSNWNSSSRPVFWGCCLALSEGRYYVTSFSFGTLFGGGGGRIENANAINGISAPTRAGYTFGGWYNNANYTGTAISATGIANYLTGTFYIKWTSSGGILPILSDVEQYELTVEEIAMILGVNLEEENL